VTLRQRRWRGPTRRAALLVLAASLLPLPAFAADSTAKAAPDAKPVAHVSLKQAVASEAARTPLLNARTTETRHDDQAGPSKTSSFFHSRPGMIAIAVMALGGGYAVYSANHDRIKSPGKK
jgi:hypothetical protein